MIEEPNKQGQKNKIPRICEVNKVRSRASGKKATRRAGTHKKGGSPSPSAGTLPDALCRRRASNDMMPATPATAAAQIRQRPLPSSSSSSASSGDPRLRARMRLPARPRAAPPSSMSAEARAAPSPVTVAVPPPAHPTYDLSAVIALALSEDAGDRGMRMRVLASLPSLLSPPPLFFPPEIPTGLATFTAPSVLQYCFCSRF
jgi:hypothetical protein